MDADTCAFGDRDDGNRWQGRQGLFNEFQSQPRAELFSRALGSRHLRVVGQSEAGGVVCVVHKVEDDFAVKPTGDGPFAADEADARDR